MILLALTFLASSFLLDIPGLKVKNIRTIIAISLSLYEVIIVYLYCNNDPIFEVLIKLGIVYIFAVFICPFMFNEEAAFTYTDTQSHYNPACHMTAFRLYQSYEAQTRCSICFEDMDPLRRHPSLYLLKCGHIFHRRCLKRDERRLWRMEDRDHRRNRNRNVNIRYGRCPICLTQYNATNERFKYREFIKYQNECTEMERAMVGRGFFGLQWHFDRDYGFFAQFPRFHL